MERSLRWRIEAVADPLPTMERSLRWRIEAMADPLPTMERSLRWGTEAEDDPVPTMERYLRWGTDPQKEAAAAALAHLASDADVNESIEHNLPHVCEELTAVRSRTSRPLVGH